MYSEDTIKILQFTINNGNKLKFLPFKLVKSPKGIPKFLADTNKFQLILWKLSVEYLVNFQITYIVFGMWIDFTHYNSI